MYAVAVTALAQLVQDGEELCIFPQNIREFWNVATRPAGKNGLGFSISQVEAEVARIESAFKIQQDGLQVYREWRRLVLLHQVSGTEVHDCYIAAGMRVRKVERLLTFNTTDFTRYGVTAVGPKDI
jgi:predicted nucleic acid-binding protein